MTYFFWISFGRLIEIKHSIYFFWMTNFAALRQHLPLLRRERQNYASGTLIALVRSPIVKKIPIFFFFWYLIFDCCTVVCRIFDCHFWSSSWSQWSYFFSLSGLQSSSSGACGKWQKQKSNCASAPAHSSLHGQLEGYYFWIIQVLQKLLHGQLEGYYFLLIQVLQKLE